MKRDIINYGEFLAAIDKLFTQRQICAYKEFKQHTIEAKERRKENLPQLSAKLLGLKADIETYKQKIRQALAEDNKKELGIRLNQLMSTKQELVKIYRAEKNSIMFSELSTGAKTYACTKSLVQKYLLTAFVKSSPQALRINADETVSLNIDYFVNSDLYQQVTHIRDYIESYITHHSERVRGERYFIGLYKNVADFDGIVRIADEHFEKINQQNTADNIRQSHEGFEQIAVYPEHGVQAVRLKTKEALDYEGKRMHHCVAGYASKVLAGTTEIYSIRDLGDEDKELVPHATIEFQNGKIKQIKGPRDSLIDSEYVEATRLLAISLAHYKNLSEFCRAKSVADSEMRNLALYKDEQGIFHDIYNMSDEEMAEFPQIMETVKIKDTRLKSLPLQHLKLRRLEISGIITDKTVQYLAQAKEIRELSLCREAQTKLSILDLSSVNCAEIILELKEAHHVEKIILPPFADSLRIRGDMPELRAIETSSPLKVVELHGKFDKLQSVPDDIEQKLSLDGSFPSFTDFTPENFLSLEKLCLGGNVTYLPPKVVFRRLKEFDISQAQVINLEHIDLTQCSGLERVDWANSRFYHLRNIVIPHIKHFSGSHCVYDALESIDARNMPYLNFGTLEKIGEHILFKNTGHTINFPEIGGCLVTFSDAPKLKEIYFPENISKIVFLGSRFNQYNFASLAKYKELRELGLSWMREGSPELDLSLCRNLEILHMDANLRLLNLPQGIKELKVERHKDDKTSQLPDLTECVELVKVSCDFIPDMKRLPPALELLDLALFDKQDDVVIMDMSAVKNCMIKTSSSTEFPNMQKIMLAENFSDVILFKTCPLLSEIDLSRTKGSVTLKEIDYNDEIFPGERNIYVSPEQLVLLEKIKLGAQTELILPETMASLPVIIEVPPQMLQEKLNDLQQKYPCARIIKEQKSRTQLQLTGREDR